MKTYLHAVSFVIAIAFAVVACKDDPKPTPTPNPNPGGGTTLTISSVDPATGSEGSTVTITGTGFSTTLSNNIVKFGAIAAPVESASATRLVTKVPKGSTTGKVTVEVGGKTTTSTADFTVMANPPVFGSGNANSSAEITAVSAKVSSIISSKGEGVITQHGHVWSKTKNPPTLADAKSELETLPAGSAFPYKFDSELKSLEANTTYFVRGYVTVGASTIYGEAFQVKTGTASTTSTIFNSVTWSVHSTSFPKGGISDPAVLYLDGKIYTLGGGTPETSNHSTGSHPDVDDFWEYDIATKKWTMLPKMPFKGKDLQGSIIKYVYKNKIYAGDQWSGIYEYDLAIRQWTQKIKFTTSVDLPRCRIVLDDKLYAFSTEASYPSKVIDLNTFKITDIRSFQAEGGGWSPTLATFLWNNRIHFWLKLRGQSTANTKLYTIAFDPRKNTYENLGTMTNLIPQVATELEPTIAFEKNGFIYVYSRSFNNTFFLYNPTLKIMGGIAFKDKPSNFTLKPMASDEQGNMYQVLGEAAAPIGFQLPQDDPNRYDKSVNHIRFQ